LEFFKQNKLKSVEYCNTTTFENKTREKLFNNRKWASYYSVGFFKFDPNGKQRFFIDSEFRQFVDFNPESYSDLLIKELKFLEKDN
jgi:hypothetical protein